jgi:hypothetical protein
MATAAYSGSTYFGETSGSVAGSRAILERAIAEAPNNAPAPRGWLRRLLARDNSAAALVRRYRLWPAMLDAYERISREYGPARVVISSEDDMGQPYVEMECLVSEENFDLEFESEVRTHSDRLLRPGDRLRLSVFISTDSPEDDDV